MMISTSKAAPDLLRALLVACAALLVQWALVPWAGPRFPAFMTLGPAVIVTAAMLGRRPATLVLLIGATNLMLAVAPAGQWWVSAPADGVAIGLYLAIGGLMITFGGRLQPRDDRAERAEQRLTLAQDETGVGLFELDYRAGTAYASPALCKILGRPVMEGSMPLQEWLQGLDAGHVAESRRSQQAKIDAGELRYERELRVTLPDGQHHWLLSRIRLDVHERRELVAARGATLDITTRKQLDLALQATQAQLQQQLDDLAMLHTLGNRLLAMPTLDAALQAILDAVCTFHDTLFGLLQLYDADGRSRVVAHCGLTSDALTQLTAPEECVEAGYHVRHSAPLLASDHGQGSGRVLGVLTVLSTAAGLPEERLRRLTDLCAGQAAALIEREHAVSLARETQQRFDLSLQSSSVGFTILAPLRDDARRVVDFAWTYANPAAAALIGRPVDELIGRPILDVLPHAWDEPGMFERYVEVSERGGTAEFDTVTRTPGRARWLHIIASPLNGSVVLWFADITQRREEQQALQEADRRKDEFLATLAHELRNPLAPIRNALSLLTMEGAEVHAARVHEMLNRQLTHLVRLVDDLMEASRISRGQLELKREMLELTDVLRAAIEISGPLISGAGHDVHCDLPDEPLPVDGDPVRLTQIFSNLLNNAAKYTDDGGRIELSARRHGSMVEVSVQDNGIGIAADQLPKLFEMFAQIAHGRARAQGGLGIGLSLAQRLAQMHGGRVEAASGGPGHGSRFTVWLPMANDAAAPVVRPPAVTAPRIPQRVLIIDDNADAADSLALLLGHLGVDVRVEHSGETALQSMREWPPAVVLLDLGMPGMDGFEVARRLRADQSLTDVTLIALTGWGQQEDRRRTQAEGFDHHLIKPIDLNVLRSLLGSIST